MSAVTVVLLDADASARDAVRLLLQHEADVEVVAEAGTLAALDDLALVPDVVVTELALPDAPGPSVVGALRARLPGAAVVVLTAGGDPAAALEARRAGASGLVPKEAAGADLVEAVRRAAAGGTYPGGVAPRGPRAGRDLPELSERETAVLRLLALGHTNAAVAQRLGVTLRAVEADRARLQEVLGTRSKADLVRAAVEAGLVG